MYVLPYAIKVLDYVRTCAKVTPHEQRNEEMALENVPTATESRELILTRLNNILHDHTEDVRVLNERLIAISGRLVGEEGSEKIGQDWPEPSSITDQLGLQLDQLGTLLGQCRHEVERLEAL